MRDSNGSRLATLSSLSTAGAALFATAAGFLVFGAAFLAACFGDGFAAGLAAFAVCLAVLAIGCEDAGLPVGAAGLFPAGGAGLFCAAELWAAAGFAGVCAAGLTPAFALCGAADTGACFAGVVAVPLAGLVCACKPDPAAASVIPSTRVFTKRIFRSFPFRVSPPVSPDLSLRRRHSAW